MKKKLWIPIVLVIVLLAVLFLPIPRGSYDDGGTREYTALTYKIVKWNRLTPEGVYEKIRVYFGSDRNKTVDELWEQEYQPQEKRFFATVLERSHNYVLVAPLEGETERRSADKISFSIAGFDPIGARVGSVVEVRYTGEIMESYPAQIRATGWNLPKDLRYMAYPDTWLDRQSAEKKPDDFIDDIIIREIYANCFLAGKVVPFPYVIKINGTLSDQWCVGDQVYVTCENVYYDRETDRVEADLLTVEESDFELDPYVAYKPVIYLYPEEETPVSVKLALDGKLSCTYPAYKEGWAVTATPEGILTDSRGRQYNYLYWEGDLYTRYDLSRGFCVRGEDTAAFLEEALAQLGLSSREAGEFIVYWLPLMQGTPYNVISFQSDAYTDAARLAVSPSPDTVIRVFMAWYPSESYVELPKQVLSAPERTGFTVVEWGGTQLPGR